MEVDSQSSQPRVRPQKANVGNPEQMALPLRTVPATSSQKKPLYDQGPYTSRQAESCKRSASRSFAKPAAQQNAAPLVRMHEEVKLRILSHLPAQTVASICRVTCQEFHDFITGHEQKIADDIEKRERARLERHRDHINSYRVPQDLMEFIEGFRFFTRQRGTTAGEDEVASAAQKWLSHALRDSLLLGSYEATKLVRLATDLVKLQQGWQKQARKGKRKQNHSMWFVMRNQDWIAPLNEQAENLYDLVRAAPVDQPFFPVKAYSQLAWPKLRLTKTWEGGKARRPTLPHEKVHVLDLPKLPQEEIFFYYANGQWVGKAIREGSLHGLKKAGVLESVKIF